MFANSPEYRTVIGCTSDLSNAVKTELVYLSDQLLTEGFISGENHEKLNNVNHDPSLRASQLVSQVRTKVQLNPTNFHKFVRILLTRPAVNRSILEILEHKYKSFGGDKDTGIPAALESLSEQERAAAEKRVTQDHNQSQSSAAQVTSSTETATSGPMTSESMSVPQLDSMSDEEFLEMLTSEGMTKREDREIILGEGINAMSLPCLEEDDVKEVMKKLSIGGKGVFRKLWRKYRQVETKEDGLSNLLDKDLVYKSPMHYKISKFLDDISARDLRRLGGSLGVLHSKLDKVPDHQLAEHLVAAWLRKEDGVLEVGKPTLRLLATKLKAIGQNGYADDLFTSDGNCVNK